MGYRRGFKAEVDRLVEKTRTDLGLKLTDPLDPRALAEHLGIEVFVLTDLHPICPEDVKHLTEVDIGAFSGTLLERDGRRAIFINDAHAEVRQKSTIAHECSHVMLGHTPDGHFTELGIRHFDRDVEDEADWLGDCLLVPTKAVVTVVREAGSVAAAAAHFGVSEQLMRKRYNLSGAKHVIERTRAKRERSTAGPRPR